jgi:hypothetical protein
VTEVGPRESLGGLIQDFGLGLAEHGDEIHGTPPIDQLKWPRIDDP